jgi:hypothetical protein
MGVLTVRTSTWTLAAWTFALFASGCSLLLDPETCASDGDCLTGGVCTEGICVGGEAPVGGGLGGSPDAVGGAVGGQVPDVEPPPGGQPPPVDMGQGGGDADTSDVGTVGGTPTPDMGPPEAPPTCLILSPAREDDGLVSPAERLNVTVQVLDTDTPAAALVVTVNDSPVALAADNTAVVDFPLSDEGDNFIQLEANDPQGRRCSDRRRVVRDRTGPMLELRDAEEGAVPNTSTRGASPFVVRVTATDAHGVAQVTATARGVNVPDIVVENDGRHRITFVLQDGPNALTVRATDALGNVAERAFDVLYDGLDPTIRIDTPANDDLIGEPSLDVRGLAGDNQDVRSLTITATVTDDQGRPVGNGGRTSPGRDGVWALDNVVLAAGQNEVEACATDAVGRRTCAQVRVRVLPGAPSVEILLPDPSRQNVVGEADVLVEGTASEATLSVLVGIGVNVAPADLAPDGTWSSTVRLPSQGAFVIGVQPLGLNDLAGQLQTVRVLFDDTPPQVRISQPVEGACTRADTLRVEGDVSDLETSVLTVRVNGSVAPLQPNNRYRADPRVNEGLGQVLTVEAENAAGLIGRTTRNFDVDRTGPEVELAFEDGDFASADDGGFVTLRGSVSDDGCGLGADALRVNGTPALVLQDNTFSARRVLPPGRSNVIVSVTDAVGNATRVERELVVDASPPVIDMVVPNTDVATSAANFEVSARVADADSGVAEVTIGGISVAPALGVYGRRVGLVPGLNAIEIVAVDNVGLTSRVTVNVNRDGEAPEVNITSPVPGADVPDVVTVRGTVDDGADGSGVAEVRIGQTLATVSPDGTWIARGVRFPNGGQNTLLVSATDNAGNISSPVSVNVDVLDFGAVLASDVGLAGASQTGWIGLVDANGDGRTDILALSGTAEGVSKLFVQNANGDYTAVSAADAGLPEGVGVLDAAVGDLNADGNLDLVLAGDVGATGVWYGTGLGGFTTLDGIGVPEDLAATGVALGDVNRDGFLDFAFVAGDRSALYRGAFNGVYTEVDPADVTGLGDLFDLDRATLLDFNKDGVQDVVGVAAAGGRGWQGITDVARAGQFVTYESLGLAYPNVGGTALLPLDVDRDGDLDVVTLGPGSIGVNRITLAGNAVTAIDRIDAGLNALADEFVLGGGDLDGDGRDDLLTVGLSGVRYFGGTDQGFTLRNRATYGIPVLPGSLAVHVADVDADGDLDVLVGGVSGLTWLRSNLTTSRRDTYTYARVHAVRGRNAMPPFDSVGIIAIHDRAVAPITSRAVVHPAFGPLVLSYAGAPSASVTLRWIDKTARAGNDTIIVPVLAPQNPGAMPLRQNAPE